MASQTIADRIWTKTRPLPNGCIEWIGTKDSKGFGRLQVGSRTDGTRRMTLVHRWVYALDNGLDSTPRGVQLVHLCGNRACVAPAHLTPLVPGRAPRVRPAYAPAPSRRTPHVLREKFWTRTRIAADCDCRLCAATNDVAAKCIVWVGAKSDQGYGIFCDGTFRVRAHRRAYELTVGPIPEGLQLDHLCRVRHCVSPAHLEAVTYEENQRRGLNGVLRGIIRGQRARAPRRPPGPATHCQNGHELTPENTYSEPPNKRNPNGCRRCRTCCRARKRERRLAARQAQRATAA